ncbi:MAG: hypothetical protein HY297_01455, partial [Thaumarchaeota archaeon]|nr:hypothetical protein [Nitrososphaerota archaeon]
KPLVRAAARVADEWNVFLSPTEAYLELKKTLDAEVDGRQVTISETGPYLIGRNAAELEENAKLQAAKLGWDLSPREVLKRLGARNAPCGTAEEFVDKLRSKMDVGIERFYFQTLVPQNTAMVGLLADTLKRGV